MCGIAGLWRLPGPDPLDRERIQRMALTLIPRGPDDFGFLLADTVHGRASAGQNLDSDFVPDLLLASRRLSILDLSVTGRQPIANETEDIFVVFNGAIHNYLELRQELEGFGHVFQSHTDTEVIVHAYEQWGPDCANRFNGMWAYAIWDQKNRRLVCSRDRFGIKPLVIARHGGAFFFGSEVKALLAAGIPAEPNPRFLQQHLSYGFFVPGEETPFANIGQVPAGHNLVVTPGGERLSRYWSYTDRSEAYDYGDPVACFQELLDDAVRLRLRSDVPLAALLSGGIDSSAVTVKAANHQDRFEAFISAFPGYVKDEQHHAERVAHSRDIPLNVVLYDAKDLQQDIDSVTWAMDMPPSIGQIPARWRLLQAVSQKARIVLEGQGADELLGGYPSRYLKPYAQSELASLRPWNLVPRLPRIVAAHHRRKRPWLGRAKRRRARHEAFVPDTLLSPDLRDLIQQAERADAGPAPDLPSKLHEKLWRDHAFDWLPHLLHYGDAISMAHSVESRMPFLDHRLVEFAFGLPFDQLVRGTETKHILRQAVAAELPREIVQRRDKIGYETPTDRWIRERMDSDIRPLPTSARVHERGVFDQQALDQCLRRAATDSSCAHLTFLCSGLESWFRLCVDGEGLANLPSATETRQPPTALRSSAAEPATANATAV